MTDRLSYARFDADTAQDLVEDLVALYLDVYANHDPEFFNEDRYRRQLSGHLQAPRWEVVTADADGRLVGYCYGFALPATTRWWQGLTEDVDDSLIAETGERTAAISEILVASDWRRRGIARRLHDEFLAGRTEERATLLVEVDNPVAANAYRSWGWEPFGLLQPSWDNAPVYEALLLDLHDEA